MFYYSKYNLKLNTNYGTIDDCTLFRSGKAQILRPYVTPNNIIHNPDKKQYYDNYGYHFGVDLVPYNEDRYLTKSDYEIPVYASAIGVVLSVTGYSIPEENNKENTKAVVIQYDANNTFRVGNLYEVSVEAGDKVLYDDIIGKAQKWVHFEYLTPIKEYSTAPIYIFDKMKLYHSDPSRYFMQNLTGVDFGIGD